MNSICSATSWVTAASAIGPTSPPTATSTKVCSPPALTRAGYVPDQSSHALHRLRTEADHPQRSLHENNKAVYSLLR